MPSPHPLPTPSGCLSFTKGHAITIGGAASVKNSAITISKPEAGSTLQKCGKYSLNFAVPGGSTPVDATIVNGAGAVVHTLGKGLTKATLDFTLDASLSAGTYKLRVAPAASASGSTCIDAAEMTFSVSAWGANDVAITSPKAGEKWNLCSTQYPSWTFPAGAAPYKAELCFGDDGRGGQNCKVVTASTSNQLAPFTVTADTPIGEHTLKVSSKDLSADCIPAVTMKVPVVKPAITGLKLLDPDGAETTQIHSPCTYEIAWGVPALMFVTLELCASGTDTCIDIAGAPVAGDKFTWSPPMNAPLGWDKAKVRCDAQHARHLFCWRPHSFP